MRPRNVAGASGVAAFWAASRIWASSVRRAIAASPIRSTAEASAAPNARKTAASVAPSLVARFSPAGQELVEIVAERTGRSPSGERPPTLRHLVVAASVNASMVVGTAVMADREMVVMIRYPDNPAGAIVLRYESDAPAASRRRGR